MMAFLSSWTWRGRFGSQDAAPPVPRPGAYSRSCDSIDAMPPFALEGVDLGTALMPSMHKSQHLCEPHHHKYLGEFEKRGHRRNRSSGGGTLVAGSAEKGIVKKTRCGLCGTNALERDVVSPRETAPPPCCSVEDHLSSKNQPSSRDLVAISQLGHGSFGRVYLVAHKSKVARAKRDGDASCLSALKAIPLELLNTRKKIEHVAYERRVLEALNDHPNVIQLRSAWRCPNALYLLTEVAWGGELFRHLQHKRRFEPRQVAFLATEISSALEHAHTLRIAYRDLKPENVLLDATGHVKLVDFGLSKIIGGQFPADDATRGCRSLCGTPEYMAPETLARLEYGYSVDFWALGMLVAELLCGLPPWYTSDRDELFRRIRFDPLDLSPVAQAVVKGKCRGAPDTDMSEKAVQERWHTARDATSFIASLLDRNPLSRLGTCASPTTHAFIRRFGLSGLHPAQLQKLTPPYNPATIAQFQRGDTTNQDRSATVAPSALVQARPCGFLHALSMHFGRGPLVSIDVNDISVELAKPNSNHDYHVKKVGELPQRSRAIRAWTYLPPPPRQTVSQGPVV